MTRAASLADMLLHAPRRDALTHLPLADHLLSVKRFTLEDGTAAYIGKALREQPRLVADGIDFAIPPFERMWVEFNFPPFFEAITGTRWDHTKGDRRLGFLLLGKAVYVGSEGPRVCGFSPMRYRLDQPWTLAEELAMAERFGISRMQLDEFFWGSTGMRLRDQHNMNALRILRAHHSFDLLPTKTHLTREQWQRFLFGANGDLRTIIASLIFLNRTTSMQARREVPMQSGFVNRHPARLHAHTVIGLEIDPLPRLRAICAGEGVWRRLHDVRGHFCHDRTTREAHGCDHDWSEVDEMLWKCQRCMGKRWWRKEHRRGNIEKGHGTAEYSVGVSPSCESR